MNILKYVLLGIISIVGIIYLVGLNYYMYEWLTGVKEQRGAFGQFRYNKTSRTVNRVIAIVFFFFEIIVLAIYVIAALT